MSNVSLEKFVSKFTTKILTMTDFIEVNLQLRLQNGLSRKVRRTKTTRTRRRESLLWSWLDIFPS